METPNDLFNKFLTKIGEDIFGKVKILDNVNTNITNTNLNTTEIESNQDYKLKSGKKFLVSSEMIGTTLNCGLQIENVTGKNIIVRTKFSGSSQFTLGVNKNSVFQVGNPVQIFGYQKNNIQNGLPSGLNIVGLQYPTSLLPSGTKIYTGFGVYTSTDIDFNQEFVLNGGETVTIYANTVAGSSTTGYFELDIEILD